MTTKAKLIPFGFIQKAHGLRGEVLVVLDSGEPLEPFPSVVYTVVEEDVQKLEIACLRWTPKGPIIQFQSCRQRRQAEALKGFVLYFDADVFQSEDFHLFEVLGFLVQVQREKALKNVGYVSHFLSHSHQDLLVVQCTDSVDFGKERSFRNLQKSCFVQDEQQVEIPFVSSYIQSISFKEKKIILKLPQGFPGIDSV